MNKISGKLLYTMGLEGKQKHATIELDPVDVSKIKKGDEVWAKGIIDSVGETNIKVSTAGGWFIISNKSLVAHFPKQEEKTELCQEEKTELCIDYIDTRYNDTVKIILALNEIIRYLKAREK